MAYRVLSLDGGGCWALVEVMALIRLYGETTPGHAVLADFDLAAGNSGGAIVLGALLENLTLAQIRDYFLNPTEREALFTPGGSVADKVLNFAHIGPKYATEPKLHALKRLLPTAGSQPLADLPAKLVGPQGAPLRVLIVGFDYDHDRAVFFRSHATDAPAWGSGDHAGRVTLAEAIHASSTPPVNYFDSPATLPSTPGRFWDGGITGQNNPVLAAVVEAIQCGAAREEIIALSLGTGTVCLPDPQHPGAARVYEAVRPDQTLINDVAKLARAVLDDPPDAASFLAHVMTQTAQTQVQHGQISRIVRMSPLIAPLGKPGGWTLPGGFDDQQFSALVKLPMDATAQPDVLAILALATAWLNGQVSNQAIRMNHDGWIWELGHAWAADAMAAWRALCSPPPAVA